MDPVVEGLTVVHTGTVLYSTVLNKASIVEA